MNELKLLICSDIHGNYENLKKLIDCYFTKGNFDYLIILGDLYYSGARNIPPQNYSPKQCVELLNSFSDKILCVKGNCEAEVDQMVSNFKIKPYIKRRFLNKVFFFEHGHKEYYKKQIENLDYIFVGHSHIKRFEKINNAYIINPGSVGLPKDNSASFCVVKLTNDDVDIKLVDL